MLPLFISFLKYHSTIVLISFVEKLFDFPSNDFATSIPFLKPVFYDLTVIIFWTPTFSINYIFCKNIINT